MTGFVRNAPMFALRPAVWIFFFKFSRYSCVASTPTNGSSGILVSKPVNL